MYEFVILVLFGLAVVFAYRVACKMITTNSINRVPLLYHQRKHPKTKTLFNQFVEAARLVVLGLNDSESGFYARLNARISSTPHMDKSKSLTSLLCYKLSQSLLIIAFFLPVEYFILFILGLLLVSWINDKTITVQNIGFLLGYCLLRFCIEMFMRIAEIAHQQSYEELPGYLYYRFSQEHLGMYLFNGFIFPFFGLNLALMAPLILILCIVFKLTVFQYLLILVGVFLGSVFRSYFTAHLTKGIFFEVIKENFVFYLLSVLWSCVTLFVLSIFGSDLLDTVIDTTNVIPAASFILFIVALTGMTLLCYANFFQSVSEIAFKKRVGKKIKFRYYKSLFQETSLGMKIMMNELRTYSIEQSIYFEKATEGINSGHLDEMEIEKIHQHLLDHAAEIKEYMKELYNGDETYFYEENLVLCTKFFDGAQQLEANFFEKIKLLKVLLDEKSTQFSLYFHNIIESEDAVYWAYETILRTLDKEDIDILSTIIKNKALKSQEIEEIKQKHLSGAQGDISETQRTTILELTHYYQINLWLIEQQNEILDSWSNNFKNTPYILGREVV